MMALRCPCLAMILGSHFQTPVSQVYKILCLHILPHDDYLVYHICQSQLKLSVTSVLWYFEKLLHLNTVN